MWSASAAAYSAWFRRYAPRLLKAQSVQPATHTMFRVMGGGVPTFYCPICESRIDAWDDRHRPWDVRRA